MTKYFPADFLLSERRVLNLSARQDTKQEERMNDLAESFVWRITRENEMAF